MLGLTLSLWGQKAAAAVAGLVARLMEDGTARQTEDGTARVQES